jgi:hypothetical protein
MPIIIVSAVVIAARTLVDALSMVAVFAFHLSGSNFSSEENSPVAILARICLNASKGAAMNRASGLKAHSVQKLIQSSI